jgi:hypothetical protein
VKARVFGLVVALLIVVVLPAGAAPEVAVDKSDNVKAVAHIPYEGGSELAFDGNLVYAGQFNGKFNRGEIREQGGAFIIDIGKKKPKAVGYAPCPGDDADVATAGRRLLAISYNQPPLCDPTSNIVLFDTSNPRRPKQLGGIQAAGGAHTITPYPGKPLIYSSPGGLGSQAESIIDVSNPKKPVLAATFNAPPLGCHDWSFHITKDEKLGFCAGGGQVSIWDVSDPLAPSRISVIVNPLVEFPHYALASPDGDLLVIDDEAFAGHECVSGQSPTGAAFFYDISNPTLPVPVGRFAPKRGSQPVGVYGDVGPVNGWADSWCTSHHFNFVPGTRNLVISWFSGGSSVLDLTNPSLPEEIAYYHPEDAVAWTAHWYNGYVLINDMARGFEMLQVKGLKEAKKKS